ncbi:lysine exporter LysO family protein [Larsenimonas suaedae]|uniref:Lysine exporter LysO family protein n=1 Tax=Larsenimonas suaedae TaxID=1851019 RepID=A0ABU1GUR8_9GAMM|nr:lysine exporter LysO family protein [Larsenimonas suaedae]MCM2972003.1 lysine exporter LysO family protein [Larsenimonas suaedae]MDR5895555.1 lysine exporter LysO family protein [Larsenimonas suaedae]
MSGLWWMALPLIVGYGWPFKRQTIKPLVDALVMPTIFLLLFLMGFGFAGLENLSRDLSRIAYGAAVLLCSTALLNIAALLLLDRAYRFRQRKQVELGAESDAAQASLWSSLKDGALMIGLVALGTLCGYLFPVILPFSDATAEAVLYLLLALVGLQLRNSGIPLKQLLLNRRGLLIALSVALTSQLAGLVSAAVLSLPLTQGLALASGFGWYSLSGILMTDQLGPLLGGVALLNDLGRELVALLIVPLIAATRPGTAVGYCGATSMDVTLPVLSRSGGLACVPLALVSGFLLSLLSPPLMMLWLSMGT